MVCADQGKEAQISQREFLAAPTRWALPHLRSPYPAGGQLHPAPGPAHPPAPRSGYCAGDLSGGPADSPSTKTPRELPMHLPFPGQPPKTCVSQVLSRQCLCRPLSTAAKAIQDKSCEGVHDLWLTESTPLVPPKLQGTAAGKKWDRGATEERRETVAEVQRTLPD